LTAGGTVWRRAGLFTGVALLLSACAGGGLNPGGSGSGTDGGTHAYPDNYKAEILAGMHAYLNDPSGIRDAAISEPMLKEVGNGTGTRYVVCLRFNGKRDNGSYAGLKQIEAVFLAGRFQDFVDAPREPCLTATYAAFPELEQLKR
jgi:hypothetical protein